MYDCEETTDDIAMDIFCAWEYKEDKKITEMIVNYTQEIIMPHCESGTPGRYHVISIKMLLLTQNKEFIALIEDLIKSKNLDIDLENYFYNVRSLVEDMGYRYINSTKKFDNLPNLLDSWTPIQLHEIWIYDLPGDLCDEHLSQFN